MLSQALKGVRVLDFTRLYPGPLCTLMLADMGADIIKVEAPEGEMGRSMSSAFAQLNREKRSLTLNLKKEEAREIVDRLLQHTDVLVESFRPGVMARFGLDYKTLQAAHPGLIYCSITGYGQTGIDALRPGHDLNYISVAGIISLSGNPEKGYVIPPVQIADSIGAFQASVAILSALFQRNQTKVGQYLDISLLDGAFFTLILLAGGALENKNIESPQYLSGKLACYNVYRTSDNRHLALGLLEPKFWNIFCATLDMSHLADRQFQENQNELIKIISEKLATSTLEYWLQCFQDKDICLTPVQNIQEAVNSEYVRTRNLFISSNDEPALKKMRTPFAGSETGRSAPRLGEHTSEILSQAGYSNEQIEEFIRKKIV